MQFPDDQSGNDLSNMAVEMLLRVCREKFEDGRIFDSFAALLHAIKITQGEEAILHVLANAKRKIDVEYEDAKLIEEEAIDEAFQVSYNLLTSNSILKEQGNEDYLQYLFECGASIVCRACSALVPKERWEAHRKIWCDSCEFTSDIDG